MWKKGNVNITLESDGINIPSLPASTSVSVNFIYTQWFSLNSRCKKTIDTKEDSCRLWKKYLKNTPSISHSFVMIVNLNLKTIRLPNWTRWPHTRIRVQAVLYELWYTTDWNNIPENFSDQKELMEYFLSRRTIVRHELPKSKSLWMKIICFSILTGKWRVYMMYLFVIETFNDLPTINRIGIKAYSVYAIAKNTSCTGYNLCKNFLSIVPSS